MASWKRNRAAMRLTRAGDHAVRALLALLGKPAAERVTARSLAGDTRIPEEFLRKILTALARARVVRTARGPAGGVRLARRPEEISLLDIVEAVEGPIALNECLRVPPACPWMDGCPAHPVWREAQNRLRDTLAAATLASLHSAAERPRPEAEWVPVASPPLPRAV